MAATTAGQSCQRCGWIASSETAEVVTTVNRTDDASIGSPPPLLFFRSLVAEPSSWNSSNFVTLCRCPRCVPHTTQSANETRTSSECAYLSLPSEQTAARELDADCEGRTTNDKARIQHLKRPVKAMKEIDIDPPELGVVTPGEFRLFARSSILVSLNPCKVLAVHPWACSR